MANATPLLVVQIVCFLVHVVLFLSCSVLVWRDRCCFRLRQRCQPDLALPPAPGDLHTFLRCAVALLSACLCVRAADPLYAVVPHAVGYILEPIPNTLVILMVMFVSYSANRVVRKVCAVVLRFLGAQVHLSRRRAICHRAAASPCYTRSLAAC